MYETYERKEIPAKSRVVLTKEMFDDFFSRIFKGNVPELTATKGLTYDLVYNLVHGRIRSLSVGNYRPYSGWIPLAMPRKGSMPVASGGFGSHG